MHSSYYFQTTTTLKNQIDELLALSELYVQAALDERNRYIISSELPTAQVQVLCRRRHCCPPYYELIEHVTIHTQT